MLKSAALLIGVILGWLIAADVVGVIASFVFEVLPLRGVSTALFFAIWFVLGVFCGSLIYTSGGGVISRAPKGVDWLNMPGASVKGMVVLVTTAVILGGIAALCYQFLWRDGIDWEDPYVPDNMPMSVTFFVAILGMLILSHAKPRKAAP